jgi:DNA invertase Pin-like site-specific DNA recombinase
VSENTNIHHEPDDVACPGLVAAAEYLRMSTEHQNYSLQNQAEKIQDFAEGHGFEVVKTYSDSGKSGLNISHRPGLQALLDDIESGSVKYEAVLVYDVSRWGRFQDPDESAFYEFSCRRAGVAVFYCAENFGEAGTPFSTVYKNVKRVMAGEYSRELSVKICAGRRRLAGLGYYQGGKPSLGVRRMCIDAAGNPKKLLLTGERKGFPTDRVVLVPGPASEQAVVRKIFRMYVHKQMTPTEIVSVLLKNGVPPPEHAKWRNPTVRKILRNEIYIGNLVYNQSQSRLGQKKTIIPPGRWKRVVRIFPPIVDPKLFQAAQEIPFRKMKKPDEDLLEGLRELCLRNFDISAEMINAEENLVSAASYYDRFGTLSDAYRKAGIRHLTRSNYKNIIKGNIERRKEVHEKIVKAFVDEGLVVTTGNSPSEYLIDGLHRLAISVVSRHTTPSQRHRWLVTLGETATTDFTLVARLTEGNQQVLDYLLLPNHAFDVRQLSLAIRNGYEVENFRFNFLVPIIKILSSTAIEGRSHG